MGIAWTFGRKMGGGFALAVLVIALIGIAGHGSTKNLIENDAWVDHTFRVRVAIFGLESAMKDAEAGQRGYVISGDEAFLEPYESGLLTVARNFEELRTLTSDNPRQQDRLQRLRPFLDSQLLAELKRVIEVRRSEGGVAAATVIAGGLGKRYMGEFRVRMAELDKEEVMLLGQRTHDANQSAERAQAVILWGSLLGIGAIVVVGFLITISLKRQVGAAVHQIQASSTELQTAANQQATGAKEQATAMNEVSTTISELLATSRQIADSARSVAEIAEQTARASRAGEQTVAHGHEAVNGIRRQVELIVGNMLQLGKKSQQIGSVLELVSELSEQTNILAINATIEAAGAGEAGRRFGVVADEIRKLADRVGGSTKEIRLLIDDVRGAVNTSIMTTETGSKAAELGAEQFALVATAFSQIGAQVDTSTQAAKEIELSTKQQASAVEQVNVAITNVAQASKESEVSTGQTLRTAAELAHLSKQLLQIVRPRDETARRGPRLNG